MREIKFRGLRTDGNGWVYGYYYEYSGKHIICWQNHSDNVTTDHFAEVIPETISQFTGLVDKNGKEIYINDLCKDEDGYVLKVVQLECGKYALDMTPDDYIDEEVDWKQTEVVGYVHETQTDNN